MYILSHRHFVQDVPDEEPFQLKEKSTCSSETVLFSGQIK